MGNLSTSYSDYPVLQKAERIVSYSVGFILFLVVVIYAGVRGKAAYNHLPASQTDLISQATVNYPAVTLCPLEVTPFQLVECTHEIFGKPSQNCTGTRLSYVMFDGVNLTCYTLNDPLNGGTILASSSTQEELAIQIQLNSNLVKEEQGAVVYLHDQGVALYELDEGVLVDVGKITDVWITKEIITEIDGTVETDWNPKLSSATRFPVNTSKSLIDMDIVFTYQGYLQTQEYYVYGQDNWIGEVGGLAALLLFLHRAFMFLFMTIVAEVYTRKYPASKGTERLRDDV